MKKDTIIQDYHGGLYFIKGNKDKELTIFIVDDHEVYLNLLKEELSENPKFSIYTFTTGEACLDYLKLKPDLVILDYHLDGTHSYAKKGDVICEKIKEQLPQTEVVIVSSDHKLAFIAGLRKKVPGGIMFKDSYTVEKLKHESGKLMKKRKKKFANAVLIFGCTAFIIAIILWAIV
ncbi:MAG: response regulator [Flavobacteriales bacterium]|nr:response regulator [Flavobacteriales bacterium]